MAGGPTTVVQTVTDAPAPAPGPEAAISPEEAAELNNEAFALMQDGRWEEAVAFSSNAPPGPAEDVLGRFPLRGVRRVRPRRSLEALDSCPEARRHLRRSERLQGEREEITAALERCGSGKKDKDDD